MLDMELAKRNVEGRQAEQQAALVAEEAARIEHNRMMVANSQSMAASVERFRQKRIDAHGEARAKARVARDRRDVLRQERIKAANKLGFSRADLLLAQAQVDKHLPLDADTFPNEIEIDAWRQRHGLLEEEARRIAARIGTEAAELDRAEVAEDEAQVELEKAARLEMELRP